MTATIDPGDRDRAIYAALVACTAGDRPYFFAPRAAASARADAPVAKRPLEEWNRVRRLAMADAFDAIIAALIRDGYDLGKPERPDGS